MKISCNWLRQYINTDLPHEKLAELLTGCGLEVEDMRADDGAVFSGHVYRIKDFCG